MRLRKRPTVLFSVLALACCWCGLLGQLQQLPQDASTESKRGLHATLKADRGWYGDGRLEKLTFRLMNDSDQTLDSATNSWILVIDDRQVPDPGGQLLDGRPACRWIWHCAPRHNLSIWKSAITAGILPRSTRLQGLLESCRI